MSMMTDAIREQVEAEREACIAILEDLRPRNDQSDWTAIVWAKDGVLVQAINHINRRYPPDATPSPVTNEGAGR